MIECKPSNEVKNTIYSKNIKKEKFPGSDQLSLWGRILAGIESPSLAVEKHPEILQVLRSNIYRKHHRELSRAWKKAETIRLQKMRNWAQSELKFLCRSKCSVFYPFSGPDILNAQILFPYSEQYILFGLEPPGKIRNISELNQRNLARYFYYIRDSLRSILNYSFFRTNDMKIDFFKELDGIAPVLLTFLAYNQNEILRISAISLRKNGILVEDRDPEGIPGYRIYFRSKNSELSKGIQVVTYFQINIADYNLQKKKFFLEYLKKNSPYTTFIKAASYLMYKENFSMIRDFILNYSQYLVQDDSGIPLRYFSKEKWSLTFYGNYVKPIPLFANRFQPELKRIYKKKLKIKPLPFGTGYQFYPGTSNLMIAEKNKKL